jgi:Tol biopolymer transport system component
MWSIPTDGSSGTLLDNILAMLFAWPDSAYAPDWEQVIFVTPRGDQTSNQRELRIADGDESGQITYDQGESIEFKSWSPDSWSFVYQIHGGNNQGVYVGSLNAQPGNIVYYPNMIGDIKWLRSSRLV